MLGRLARPGRVAAQKAKSAIDARTLEEREMALQLRETHPEPALLARRG